MPAYPEDAYLAKVGRLAYAVADLEWLVLGDLTRQSEHLPADITVAKLAGLTTGQIAGRIRAAATQLSDGAVKSWLDVGARHLGNAAALRNHLLHARPATVEDKQRLYRWRIGAEGSDAFPISDEWLDQKLAEVESMCREVDRARMAAWQPR